MTEWKRAEEALRRSEARYRSLAHSIPSGAIFLFDHDLRYLVADGQALAAVGMDPGEVVGKTVWEMFPPEAAAKLEQWYRVALAGQTQTVVMPSHGRTYETRFAPVTDEGGVVIAGMAMAQDITERKRAEEQIATQMDMLRALYASVEQITGTINPGELAESIARMCVESFGADHAWLGRPEPDGGVAVVGRYPSGGPNSVDLSVRSDMTSEGEGPVGRAISTGEPVLIEDVLTDEDSAPWRERAVSLGFQTVAAFPLASEGQGTGCLVIYSRAAGYFSSAKLHLFQTFAHLAAAAFANATLHEAAQEYATDLEARVSERTAELTAANAELDRFAYSLAHDLRTSLWTMQGFSMALLDGLGERLGEEGRSYLGRIISAAEQMDALIREVLEYTRVTREELSLGPVDLSELVAEALVWLQQAVAHSKAEVTLLTPMPAVVAHRSALHQVVLNLLSNAVKFVKPGEAPRVRVWAEEQGERVRVWVEDQGIGIALEQQERIFRVLERLHEVDAYPGTGVGLAVVRQAVRRMGGETGVESEVGAGSRFWFELPRARAEEGEGQ